MAKKATQKDYLDQIAAAWADHPHLRIGQLLFEIVSASKAKDLDQLYYLTDAEWHDAVKEFVRRRIVSSVHES